MNEYPQSVILAISLLCLLPVSGCSAKGGRVEKTETANLFVSPAENTPGRERAARIAASLDDRRLAAQVIISGIDGKGHPAPDMRILFGECPAGGIILFKYNLDADNSAIQSLIEESAALIAAGVPGIPPLVAVDHEGGSVNRFRPGVAALPPAGTYWELARSEGLDRALARAEDDSFRAGTELKALGFNLNLAPVAEPLTADNRAFLGDRSYGPDPAFTAEAAAAFIRGMRRAGVLCGIKHFPGSAGEDPHRFPSLLRGDRANLDELAAPFAALVGRPRFAGGGQAGAVMVAHSSVPARDSENIASLSAPVMQDWLRGDLGFEGIIICDDFTMAAAGSSGRPGPEDAAVQSLAAGADMVLVWPPDIRRTHRAILAALAGEKLSRNRLREAAARIIFEKIMMGLIGDE